MIESIIMGFKDLWKNKYIFIVFLFSVLLICLTGISATTGLMGELDANNELSQDVYTLTPVSNDMSANASLANEMNLLLKEGGSTFFYSEKISEDTGVPTAVVIDYERDEKLPQGIVGKIYANSSVRQIVDLNSIQFPEKVLLGGHIDNKFDERLFDYFYRDEVILLVLQTNNLDQWVESPFGLDLVTLVENTRFDVEEIGRGLEKEFVTLFDDSFIHIQVHTNQNEEIPFILLYVYPAIAVVIASLFLATVILYSSLFKHLTRTYTIHLISGATLPHIYLRNSIFTVALVVLCFGFISFLNGFQINEIFWTALSILAILFLTLATLLYLVLKRENLSMTLKGDE